MSKFAFPIQLPSLTTAQRNALTAAAGMVIWNSDKSVEEYYDGAAWHGVPQIIRAERGTGMTNQTTVVSVFSSAPTITPVAGDIYELEIAGLWTNNTGAGQTLSYELLWNGGVIGTNNATASNVSAANPHYVCWVAHLHFITIAAGGSALTGWDSRFTSSSAGANPPQQESGTSTFVGAGVDTTASNVSGVLDAKFQLSTVTGGGSWTPSTVRLHRIPT